MRCLKKLLDVNERLKVIMTCGYCDGKQVWSVREIGVHALVKKPDDIREMVTSQ